MYGSEAASYIVSQINVQSRNDSFCPIASILLEAFRANSIMSYTVMIL